MSSPSTIRKGFTTMKTNCYDFDRMFNGLTVKVYRCCECVYIWYGYKENGEYYFHWSIYGYEKKVHTVKLNYYPWVLGHHGNAPYGTPQGYITINLHNHSFRVSFY